MFSMSAFLQWVQTDGVPLSLGMHALRLHPARDSDGTGGHEGRPSEAPRKQPEEKTSRTVTKLALSG